MNAGRQVAASGARGLFQEFVAAFVADQPAPEIVQGARCLISIAPAVLARAPVRSVAVAWTAMPIPALTAAAQIAPTPAAPIGLSVPALRARFLAMRAPVLALGMVVPALGAALPAAAIAAPGIR